MKNLSTAISSSLIWVSLSQAVRLGGQILGLAILARFLPASDFGLIAMATVVTGFAQLFRDLGTTAAVIQRPSITPQLLDSVFWFNLAIGGGLAITLALLAPIIAWFFAETRLREVLWLLALAFPLGALGLVHQALMERNSNFKPVAIVESFGAMAGLSVAILTARAGWGAYSLVLQTLVSVATVSAGMWFFSSWRPKKGCSLSEVKSLWRFSANFFGFNVFNYFARNADNILIGRVLGTSDLGIYSIAYRLLMWPLQNISSVVGRTLFPAFSRIQTEPDKLASAYLRATAAIALVTSPLMVGLFVLREPFVTIMLGKHWLPVANLLAWLAPVGLLQSIGTTVGTLYLVTGRTDIMFRWGLLAGTLTVLAFFVGIHWGLQGLVIAYAIAMGILFWPSLLIPLRFVNLKVNQVLLIFLPSLLVAAAMGTVVILANHFWHGFASEQVSRFCVLVLIGIFVYTGLSCLFQRGLLKNIVAAFKTPKSL